MRLYLLAWIGAMVIVAIEAWLAYAHVSMGVLIASFLVLATIEAVLALRYFMNLKYEPPGLFWTLIPGFVFALLMLNHIWPDAIRIGALRFP
jgi:heme/copper-type cytochrome/quinol oxidase subunit 4